MERVGIYGGTFDPIHNGHLAIAEEACWALGLVRLYVVPAARQPLKNGPQGASPEQRLAMAQLACADNPHLVVSDLELRRPPPSYTIDTLRSFRDLLGSAAELYFILGADALASLGLWHRAREIVDLAQLAALTRPGATLDLDQLEREIPGMMARTTLIEGPLLDISGTDLRRRLAEGRPVRYQLPEAVREYVQAHGLYRENTDD
jgi:nicotinate-nucleotide adenylyltransferase